MTNRNSVKRESRIEGGGERVRERGRESKRESKRENKRGRESEGERVNKRE